MRKTLRAALVGAIAVPLAVTGAGVALADHGDRPAEDGHDQDANHDESEEAGGSEDGGDTSGLPPALDPAGLVTDLMTSVAPADAQDGDDADDSEDDAPEVPTAVHVPATAMPAPSF